MPGNPGELGGTAAYDRHGAEERIGRLRVFVEHAVLSAVVGTGTNCYVKHVEAYSKDNTHIQSHRVVSG